LFELDRTVRAGLAGVQVASYRDREGEQRDIVVRLPMEDGPRLAHLDRIAVTVPSGSAVPLQQLATLEFEPAPARIDHFDLERAVTVTAEVRSGYNVAGVTQEMLGRLRELEWPAGYRVFVGGELEALGESFGGLGRALVVALVGIFGVLVLQFRSFVQPLVVFSAIPLAVVGSLGALLLTGYSFSFMAFVGLAALVGIVVNNSIILVDFANGRRAGGVALVDAIEEAAVVRFVPILLTTMTTIGGLLPLTLTGSDLWSPLGWALIGGLASSTVLTLVVVPSLMRVFTRAS
jgi:multidrug efflux pump subunit AcrB